MLQVRQTLETNHVHPDISPAEIWQEHSAKLEGQGYRSRLVSICHVRELQAELEEQHQLSRFDPGFYHERLANFEYRPAGDFPEARSLIIVAYPHPQTRLFFTWQGKQVPLIIPPTYLHGGQEDRNIRDSLAAALHPYGYRVSEAFLPIKLLAVRSGLGAYGKNNVCYVEGLGSFVRLVAFYSDLPCSAEPWRELQMMEACQTCSACARKCPTGAITAERFLLHAERCITYWNEKPGDVDFPAWLDPAWHNCLVGCLTCQLICPQNRDCPPGSRDGAIFSEEETACLLQRISLDRLPRALAEKIVQFDLVDYLEILPRNVPVLLKETRVDAAVQGHVV